MLSMVACYHVLHYRRHISSQTLRCAAAAAAATPPPAYGEC